MNKQLDYTLAALRRCCDNSYPWSVTPAEAGLLVAEVERLRSEVEAAHAEAATMRSWAEEAAAAENANADVATTERAAERAAVVAFLTGENDARCRFISDHVAMRIERGEHRHEGAE